MAVKEKTRKVASQGLRGSLPRDVKSNARAGGKHVGGSALGELVLKMIASHANAEVKQKAELKENLRALLPLTAEEHKDFRGTLGKRRSEIDDAKKAAGCATMQDYFKLNPKAGSEYVRISEWGKLSEACEKGWTPTFEMGWGAIVQEARQVQDTSTASANPDLVQQLIKLRNDASLPEEQREVMEAELVKEINSTLLPVPAASATPTTQNQSASGATVDKPLFEQCLALFKDRPIGDVERLMAQVGFYIAEKVHKPVKHIFDQVYADHVAKAQQASTVGAVGKAETKKGEKEEHATAKGETNPMHQRKRKTAK